MFKLAADQIQRPRTKSSQSRLRAGWLGPSQ
jgi:hypothetical protein